MEFVDIGYAKGWKHEEKNDVTEDEIGGEHAQLGDLAHKFSAGLRHGVSV